MFRESMSPLPWRQNNVTTRLETLSCCRVLDLALNKKAREKVEREALLISFENEKIYNFRQYRG